MGRRREQVKMLWQRFHAWIYLEVAVLWVAGAWLLPGGDDFYRHYLPFAKGCVPCGFVPPFAQWVLWPLRWLPTRGGWVFWTAISLVGWWVVAKTVETAPVLVLLSFPAFGELWLGQIDVVIALGLLLVWRASKGWQQGVGVFLALIKPQISALALLVLLLDASPQKRKSMVGIPLVAFLVSLAVFGPLWPWRWWVHAQNGVPNHVWRLAAQMLWPYGLLAIPVVFIAHTPRSRFLQSLYATALASPFFGVYAYTVFLAFEAPWWSLPLSFAWALLYPWLGAQALKFAWVLPAGLLLHTAITERCLFSQKRYHAAPTR